MQISAAILIDAIITLIRRPRREIRDYRATFHESKVHSA